MNLKDNLAQSSMRPIKPVNYDRVNIVLDAVVLADVALPNHFPKNVLMSFYLPMPTTPLSFLHKSYYSFHINSNFYYTIGTTIFCTLYCTLSIVCYSIAALQPAMSTNVLM